MIGDGDKQGTRDVTPDRRAQPSSTRLASGPSNRRERRDTPGSASSR
jgi:hypothetical protein